MSFTGDEPDIQLKINFLRDVLFESFFCQFVNLPYLGKKIHKKFFKCGRVGITG